MTDPIPEFYCAECGRYLGKLAAHVILDDDRVICSRHRIDHERRGYQGWVLFACYCCHALGVMASRRLINDKVATGPVPHYAKATRETRLFDQALLDLLHEGVGTPCLDHPSCATPAGRTDIETRPRRSPSTLISRPGP